MTVTAIVPVDKRKCKVFLGEDFAFVWLFVKSWGKLKVTRNE